MKADSEGHRKIEYVNKLEEGFKLVAPEIEKMVLSIDETTSEKKRKRTKEDIWGEIDEQLALFPDGDKPDIAIKRVQATKKQQIDDELDRIKHIFDESFAISSNSGRVRKRKKTPDA